jgi:signal transduction histidine kinase
LRGYTDVLLMGVRDDPDTADRVLQAMREDLRRMSRLVDDLLTLARIDGGSPLRLERIQVAELLEAAAIEGYAVAGQSRDIVREPIDTGLVVRGDRDRLRQVLSNLIGNACVYCPPRSTIWLSAEAADSQVKIIVRDDGPGIPPDDLARLGERFYRGDAARSRNTGGTGLGLAIARSIVEAHGGTLEVSSRLGQGTTVIMCMPRSGRESPAAQNLVGYSRQS